jgi:hypothetical protein
MVSDDKAGENAPEDWIEDARRLRRAAGLLRLVQHEYWAERLRLIEVARLVRRIGLKNGTLSDG